MPFAQLPSSPGFQQPQAPSWEPFALQANQNIERGGELRAAAGKEFADSISKAADQITGILQYQSPEARAQRRLQMIQTQAMTQMYNDYTLHPEKYQLTAHGPVLKDGFEQARKVAGLRNEVLAGDLSQLRINKEKEAAKSANVFDKFRDYGDNVDTTGLPTTGSYGDPPAGAQPPEEPAAPDVVPAMTNQPPPVVAPPVTETPP